MNIEKLKVFLKEWKKDRVKNGNCETYSKRCRECPYSKDVFEVEGADEDIGLFKICELLEKIEEAVVLNEIKN